MTVIAASVLVDIPVLPGVSDPATAYADPVSPPATTPVSVAADGTVAGGTSPAVSADGRWVAFVSAATNIVADPRPHNDVFLRDVVAGTTVLVSVTPAGESANGPSGSPTVSPDGRFVAFDSEATDVVADDTNAVRDVFRRDMQTGVTTRVSLGQGGAEGNGNSQTPSMSADGNRIAFGSNANNLVAGDTNAMLGGHDVFVRDLAAATTIRIVIVGFTAACPQSCPGGIGGSQFTEAHLGRQALSADGRQVVFRGHFHGGPFATGPCTGNHELIETIAYDTAADTMTRLAGTSYQCSTLPAVSPDRSIVVYTDRSGGFTSIPPTGGARIPLAVGAGGAAANGGLSSPLLSTNGGRIAFSSGATNLVAGDTNGREDAFTIDRAGGGSVRVSVNSAGAQAASYPPGSTGGSGQTAISGDGTRVAFASLATDLVGGDTNGAYDVFLRVAGVPPVGGPLTPEEGACGNRAIPNAGAAQASAGDPVNTCNGNFYDTFTDLAIPGRGPALSFQRSYNSLFAATDGALGFGWTHNYAMSVSVDGAGVVTVHQETGAQVSFTPAGGAYTAPPRVVATLVATPGGGWTFTRGSRETFTFDAGRRLVSVSDLNGHTNTLAYDGAGQLATVTEGGTGRSLSFAWAADHIKSVTDANEPSKPPRVATFAYGAGDAGPDLTEVLDVTGGRTNFAYDADHRVTRMRFPNQFDPDVAVGSDPETLRNVYDGSGRVTTQTDPEDRTTSFDYTSVPGSTIVTTPPTQAPDGATVTHRRLDTYQFGLLVTQVKGYESAGAARWDFEYDPATLGITRVIDPDHKSWVATYDGAANRTSATDPLGRTTTWTWTDKNLPETMVDPRGHEPGANVALWTTTFDYDDEGCGCNLKSRSRPLLDNDGTAVVDTQTTEYRYGERGHHPADLTTVVDPLAKEWKTDYNADGYPVAVTDPLGHRTTAHFDGWGRKTSEVGARGNLGPTPDPAYQSTFTYDADNRLRTSTTANPPGPPLTSATTYDANRNLATSTDGNNNETSYDYDAANQLTVVHRPDTTTLAADYWDDGSLRAQRDGVGEATQYF